MDICVTGRHVNITDALREHARERLVRLEEHGIPLLRIQVTLDLDGGMHMAELIATTRKGAPLVANARTEDMYAAIDAAAEKLEQQVRRLKDKVKDHRRTRPTETAE